MRGELFLRQMRQESPCVKEYVVPAYGLDNGYACRDELIDAILSRMHESVVDVPITHGSAGAKLQKLVGGDDA